MTAVEGKSTSEVNENIITIARVYDAPKELLFSMFSNPEHLEKWWGPTHWPASFSAFDFKEGGEWFYHMTGPDGTKAYGKAVFETIDEPNLLAYRDMFADEHGTVNETLPQGSITFKFVEENGKTTLTMTGQYPTAADTAKLVEMGMLDGMADTWTQLEKLVAAAK